MKTKQAWSNIQRVSHSLHFRLVFLCLALGVYDTYILREEHLKCDCLWVFIAFYESLKFRLHWWVNNWFQLLCLIYGLATSIQGWIVWRQWSKVTSWPEMSVFICFWMISISLVLTHLCSHNTEVWQMPTRWSLRQNHSGFSSQVWFQAIQGWVAKPVEMVFHQSMFSFIQVIK